MKLTQAQEKAITQLRKHKNKQNIACADGIRMSTLNSLVEKGLIKIHSVIKGNVLVTPRKKEKTRTVLVTVLVD
ncbi:hypothetical protein KKF82_05395 [Patescibacteria group bacterium]|nr:hypothetical protein [Patescibacteria group bacterium]